MSISDTPRTDVTIYQRSQNCVMVDADFARTLEHELNSANAQIVALQKENIAMRDACNVALKTDRGEALSDHALTCLEQALSSPAPLVVPLEDAEELAQAIENHSKPGMQGLLKYKLDFYRSKHPKKEDS